MSSNEECRAIAKKLRYVANDDLGELSLQKNLAAITKAEDGSWRGVMRRLADLIDRPTCRNVSGHQDVFVCSECRCTVEIVGEDCNEYGEIFSTPFMPGFCPSCGAEVVDE